MNSDKDVNTRAVSSDSPLPSRLVNSENVANVRIGAITGVLKPEVY